MKTKSIKESKAQFCEHWRRAATDNEFMSFIEKLVSENDTFRRGHVRLLFTMKPGDDWYSVNNDQILKVID